MCTTYGIGLMTTAGPAGFGNPEMDGIVAFPASHFGQAHFGHSRYSQQQREELSLMFSLVKELSTRFSRLCQSTSKEVVLSHISSNQGRGTTNPDVGQAATFSNNIDDGSLSVSNHLRSTTDPMDGITCVEDFFKEDDNLASLVHFFNGLEPITSLDGLSEGNDGTPNQSPEEIINSESDVVGDTILPEVYLDSSLMSDLPWVDDDSKRGKHHQEQKDPKLGKELISCMEKVVPEKLQEVEASYRSMLQDLKSLTVNISYNLRKGVNRLKDSLYLHFDEMTRSVRSFSNSAPKARKLLPNSIGRLIDMCKGDVQHLLQETNTLIMTLGNFGKQLDARELSLEDGFKKCASSIYLSVESSLCKQNSNNISVATSSE